MTTYYNKYMTGRYL